ncbi:MAG: DUF3299 domain-containing protein [Bacteroidota bacterium]
MNHLRVIILVCLSLPMSLIGQESTTLITWDDLMDVSYTTIFDEEAGYVYMKPTYGQNLQELNGKRITIKGYVLPMDTEGTLYALSAFPYTSCFFCGGGTRESVVELWLSDLDKRFKLDEVLTFEGELYLNEEQHGLNYILKEARPKE